MHQLVSKSLGKGRFSVPGRSREEDAMSCPEIIGMQQVRAVLLFHNFAYLLFNSQGQEKTAELPLGSDFIEKFTLRFQAVAV